MSGSSSRRQYKMKMATMLMRVDNDDNPIGTIAVPVNTVCTCVRRRNVPRTHGYGSRNSVEEYGSPMVADQGYVVSCTIDGEKHSNLLLLDSEIEAGRAVRVRHPLVRERKTRRRLVAMSRAKSRRGHVNHKGPHK